MTTKPTPASQPSTATNTEAEKMLAMRADYDRQQGAARGLLMPQPSPARSDKDAERCPHCDGTGDVHRADGEWLGACDCEAERAPSGELIEAAEAVIARWDSPKWKDEAPTADFIARLRRAVDEARCATAGTAAAPALDALFSVRDHAEKKGDAELYNIAMRGILTQHRATAGNAAPACSGCDPAEGFCRACRDAEQRARNAATAAPGDLPEPIWNPLDTPEFRECLDAYTSAMAKASLFDSASVNASFDTRKNLLDFLEAWGAKFLASNAGAAPAIPEGFVLMPRSPSEAVLAPDGWPRMKYARYQAMLAATPTPQTD